MLLVIIHILSSSDCCDKGHKADVFTVERKYDQIDVVDVTLTRFQECRTPLQAFKLLRHHRIANLLVSLFDDFENCNNPSSYLTNVYVDGIISMVPTMQYAFRKVVMICKGLSFLTLLF